MKMETVTPQQAEKMRRDVLAAPMLDLSQDEGIYQVRRVGFVIGPIQRPDAVPHFETIAGKIYRLPPELTAWAVDVVSLALSFHNPFPCAVHFGRDGAGRAFAEVDVDPAIEPLWQPGVDHAAQVAAMLKKGGKS